MRPWKRLAVSSALLLVIIGSCSSETVDLPSDRVAGAAGANEAGANDKSGGAAGAGGGAGDAALSQGGNGGFAGGSGYGGEGVAGSACVLEHECGGCSPPLRTVTCPWGSVGVPDDTSLPTCAAAERSFEDQGGAGGQGPSLLPDGVGGSETYPDVCTGYVAPGTVITDCVGCTETSNIFKVGECEIAGECCVITESWHCGI